MWSHKLLGFVDSKAPHQPLRLYIGSCSLLSGRYTHVSINLFGSDNTYMLSDLDDINDNWKSYSLAAANKIWYYAENRLQIFEGWRIFYFKEARRAALTFLACCRFGNTINVSMDVARIIAKMVYYSEEDLCWTKIFLL